jgi:uncharacterized membrane protein YgdD (TMEM256/DUF423 family)
LKKPAVHFQNEKKQMAKIPSFPRLMVVLASLNAAAAVISGAFGAHALKSELVPELFTVYNTAVQYHMYHALGLFAVGMAACVLPESIWSKASGWFMAAGIVLFSGSLYTLSLSGWRWIGVITPIGGTLLIASWIMLAVGALKATPGRIPTSANRRSSPSNCRWR